MSRHMCMSSLGGPNGLGGTSSSSSASRPRATSRSASVFACASRSPPASHAHAAPKSQTVSRGLQSELAWSVLLCIRKHTVALCQHSC